MIDLIARVCLMVAGLSVLIAIYRVVRGPSVADRVAAMDLLTTCIMAVLVIGGIVTQSRLYIDVVMALAVLGFFGTVAFAKYMLGGRPID